jgi:hypothetical protein
MSANDIQIGGSHYKDMGQFQPWDVLRHWMTEEEYRGWMKGNALVYLARERNKGSNEDLRKALHTLTKLVEITVPVEAPVPVEKEARRKYVKKTPTKAAPYGFKPDGTPRKYKPKGWKE